MVSANITTNIDKFIIIFILELTSCLIDKKENLNKNNLDIKS